MKADSLNLLTYVEHILNTLVFLSKTGREREQKGRKKNAVSGTLQCGVWGEGVCLCLSEEKQNYNQIHRGISEIIVGHRLMAHFK